MYNGLHSSSVKGSGRSGYVERSRVHLHAGVRPPRHTDNSLESSALDTVNPLAKQRSQAENEEMAKLLMRHKARRGVYLDVLRYRKTRREEDGVTDDALLEREAQEMFRARWAKVEDLLRTEAAVERGKTAEAFAKAFDVRTDGTTAWDYAALQRQKLEAEAERRQLLETRLQQKEEGVAKRMRQEEQK